MTFKFDDQDDTVFGKGAAWLGAGALLLMIVLLVCVFV